jgi:hypothetical protein
MIHHGAGSNVLWDEGSIPCEDPHHSILACLESGPEPTRVIEYREYYCDFSDMNFSDSPLPDLNNLGQRGSATRYLSTFSRFPIQCCLGFLLPSELPLFVPRKAMDAIR